MNRPPKGLTFEGIVTNVVDGDTLDVQLRINTRIRLLECWAPELHGDDNEKRLGAIAKASLEELVLGENCTVYLPTDVRALQDVFSFGRLLARVWMDNHPLDLDLSKQQVLAGVAASGKGRKLGE